MRHHHFGDGRYVVRLDAGEDVIQSLVDLAIEEDIVAGRVTGLGSFEEVTLGWLDPDAGEYLTRRFEEPMEVANLTGTISREEDRPHVHLHGVLGPRELLAYAGHVHEAKVGAVVELFVDAFPDTLRRIPVTGQPFPGLFLPGESPPEGDDAAR